MGKEDFSAQLLDAEREARNQVAMNIRMAPGKGDLDADVNTPSLDYQAMEARRALPRALVGGTEAMRDAAEKYTPKRKGESEADLKKRLELYYLVDFYDASIKDLVGRMLSEGILLADDTPQEILDVWENIDGQGRSGEQFFYDVALDAMRFGLCEVQADFPPLPVDTAGGEVELSVADEARMNRRPFLVHHKSQDVIEVAQTDDAIPQIARARLRESKVQADLSGYGQTSKRFVRVLLPGVGDSPSSSELHEYDNDAGEWISQGPQFVRVPEGAQPDARERFQRVLLTPFSMGIQRFHFAYPVFEAGAYLCWEHWLKKGNIDHIEDLANTPTLKALGLNEDQLSVVHVGSRRVTFLPEGGDLEWLVIDPKGIEASKESKEHLEEHIRFVMRQPVVNRATGKDLVGVRQLDETRPMTQAQIWALGLARSITNCLQDMAAWYGLAYGGTAEIPKDALQRLVDPGGFENVLKMFQVGALSAGAAQREAKRYNVLDEEHDVEADLQLLATTPPGGLFDEA